MSGPLPHHERVAEHVLPNIRRLDQAWVILEGHDPSRLDEAQDLLFSVREIRPGDSEPDDAQLVLANWPTLTAQVENRPPTPDEMVITQANIAHFITDTTHDTYDPTKLRDRKAGRVRTAMGILLVARQQVPGYVARPTSPAAQLDPKQYYHMVVTSPRGPVKVRVGNSYKHRQVDTFNGVLLGIGSDLATHARNRAGQNYESSSALARARNSLTRAAARTLVAEATYEPGEYVDPTMRTLLDDLSGEILTGVQNYASRAKHTGRS